MIKEEVTCSEYKCIKKQQSIILFVKVQHSKIISVTFDKVSSGFEFRICGSQDHCHRPLSYNEIQLI